MIKYFGSLLIILATTIISGCSSSKPAESRTAEDVFNQGLSLFKSEDYIEAKQYFDIIRLQYPASKFADDAQYYLAEINYARGEYILAAFNYNRLRSLYPSSLHSKECLYKAAMSYYEMSPSFDRDQEYTLKAIETFNLYQRLYPGDSLFAQAGDKITELRDKLGHGQYFIAESYRKVNDLKAAQIYYDIVIDEYSDTKYFEQAYFGKINVLIDMKKYEEAKGAIDLYKKLFPKGSFRDDVARLESTLKTPMKN